MDAFFVSVELLRRPELRGRPVVVGGAGPRGVVAAASYEARAYGVHSAMPGARARRLCPHAVFLPGDHGHYREASQRVMAIFRSFTPVVEPLSLDEAFLDVTGARRLLGEPTALAHELRRRVLEEEGLTCSVGIARVKFLAKLASEAAKPAASPSGPVRRADIVEISPERELAFLHPLPVQALWGVGPATLARLERLGVATVGDLAALPVETLRATAARAPLRASTCTSCPCSRPTSGGGRCACEVDLPRGDVRPRPLRPHGAGVEVVRLADAVGTRLREASVRGRTITLKVRFADFTTITRSASLPAPTDSGHRIARVARQLLEGVDPAPGVRLIGVAVAHLGEGGAEQLSLDDLLDGGPDDAGWEVAEGVLDAVRARFGATAIGPASLTGPSGMRVARRGEQPWGPDAVEPPRE
jgi:DNA polymerase IV